jgi:hypothetical protein
MIAVQIASSLNLPVVLDPTRNSLWLMIAMAVVIGITLNAFMTMIERVHALRVVRAGAVAGVVAMALWFWRVPDLRGASIRSAQFVDATEYGSAAEALVGIERRLKPFSWTFVSYGQEFPHVLGRGYHLTAADFLERYDPTAPRLPIPTRYVFIVVEKSAHPFEVHAWATRFSRVDIEERLQAWCVLYQTHHDDMRVYVDSDEIRIYVVQRRDDEVRVDSSTAAAAGATRWGGRL